MVNFINTIDKLGDDTVIDSIIEDSILEFMDNGAITIYNTAFDDCNELKILNCPNATVYSPNRGGNANYLTNMSALEYVNLGGVDLSGNGTYAFRGCSNLKIADLGPGVLKGGHFSYWALYNASSLEALVLRFDGMLNNSVNSDVFSTSGIGRGIGYVYVPRALIDSYKSATNWSAYADRFRVLEDYTVDGTVTGNMVFGYVRREITGVISSNVSNIAMGSYNTTLTVINGFILQEVTITMDGVDVTSQVYNAATGEVNIPNITGHIIIRAIAMRDINVVVPANILGDVEFILGYIENNGNINTTSTGDTRTSQFDISEYAGMSIVVNLVDVKSTPTYSRIVYYNENNSVVGYTQGAASGTNVTITSTVPDTAVYAAISVNKSNGFSAIDITCDGDQIGYIEYAS